MNLLGQLTQASKPMAYAPAYKRRKGTPPPNWSVVQRLGCEVHTSNAVDRYREAFSGKGWITQTELEMCLGMASTVATTFLKKLRVKHKCVERRKYSGVRTTNFKPHWEYRWINGA